MRMVDPVKVTDAILVAASIAENDYPEWSGAATYDKGHRVILAAVHRVFESLADDNLGNNPASTAPAKWIDIGPTNRWAMFDEAIGSATTATGSISVTLAPPEIDTVGILDTDAAAIRIRIQVAGVWVHDETVPTGGVGDTLLFSDLAAPAGAQVEVTALAADMGAPVSVGTLIAGMLTDLGVTEAGPTIGINDFSRRETDDFGVTTIVERAWAKRMSIRSMIATAQADAVQRRLAAVRARPCLWIGEEGYDSLVIYGFFKDFSIDLALPEVSYCTLTVEGLTTAGAIDNQGAGLSVVFRNAASQPPTPATGSGVVPDGWSAAPLPLAGGEYRWWSQAEFRGDKQLTEWTTPVKVAGTGWGDVIDDDPDHPKPEDGATVGSPLGTDVGDITVDDVIGALKAIGLTSDPTEVVVGAQALADAMKELALATDPAGLVAGARALVERVDSAMAAIVEEAITRADAISAETSQREAAISALETSTGAAIDAAIAAEAVTRADAIGAETLQREAAISALETSTGNAINAAIASEATTRATAISAETSARETALSSLDDDLRAYVAGEVSTLVSADTAMAASITSLSTTLDGHTASIDTLSESVDGVLLRYGLKLNSNNHIIGFLANNNGVEGGFDFVADYFRIWDAGGTISQPVFAYDGGLLKMGNVEVDRIKAGSGNSAQFANAAAILPYYGTGMGNQHVVLSKTVVLLAPGAIQATAAVAPSYHGGGSPSFALYLKIDGSLIFQLGGGTTEVSACLSGSSYLPAGTYDVEVVFEGTSSVSVDSRNISTVIIYS